ncbi:hypothetical protein VE03_06653 [Pseudogymnoascus sp. 23342-1-I1]|nr:hypothetical protein VE03_06653 [Pseudogymnoascus sp. 23342-1-I1]
MILGRENVDRRDGGLGKARWERLMKSNGGRFLNRAPPGAGEAQVEAEARSACKPDLEDIVPPKAEMASELEESRTVTDTHTHHHKDSRPNGDPLDITHTNIATNGIVESRPQTIAAAESISYNGVPESPASPSPVYITITDPINGPSFKPSFTKPIPRWMRQLPNGRECEQVYLPAATSSPAAESEVDILPIKDTKDVLVPSLQPSLSEEQKPPSQITHVAAAISPIQEAILTYNDCRMTMSTPPKMHHQRPKSGSRDAMPLCIGGEMGTEYLKRGLRESRTGNVALERIRKLRSMRQVVDRVKSMQINEIGIWSEEEGEGERWQEKEMLRKELNGLFRQ